MDGYGLGFRVQGLNVTPQTSAATSHGKPEGHFDPYVLRKGNHSGCCKP